MTHSPHDATPGGGRLRAALAGWGRFAARRSTAVLVVAVLVAVVSLLAAAGTMNRLVLSRFESPGSPSMRVAQELQSRFDTGKPHFLLLLTARQGTVDDPAVSAAGLAMARELAGQPGVQDVASYWSRDNSPAMRSADKRQAVVVARLAGSVTQGRAALSEISPRFTRTTPLLRVGVGGGDEVFRQAAEQARTDFLRAELIIFPLLFGLLLLIYRRLAAATVTLVVGALGVVLTLGVLRGVTYLTDVSTFAANLTLVMGLGLAVDYCLFVINRFREELSGSTRREDAHVAQDAQNAEVARAMEQTMRTAGHTVVFSAITVAASLAMLLLFPFPFLRSFAYAGITVVTASAVCAVLVLPAVLVKLRRRIATQPAPPGGRRRVAWARRSPRRQFWSRLATSVMRHPIRYATPAVLLLAVLAAPLAGLKVGLPDDRVLPATTSSRQVQQQIRDHFAQEEMDAIQLLATPAAGQAITTSQVDAYASRLSSLEQVQQVEALTGRYSGGRRVAPSGIDSGRFTTTGTAGQPGTGSVAPGGTWFSVVAYSQYLDEDEEGVVSAVRDVPAPFSVRVGGYPAELVDFRAALIGRLPVVFGGVLLVTLAVLTLMTRSALLPVKAVILNGAVMAAMLGALVWVFQDGHLSGVLGFTPLGSLEPTIPILMLCVAFGLSMDYEVFLLSRITEEHDQGRDTPDAVAFGLQHSGPLITAAAVVLAASFATYSTSGITYLKMIAVGMALAVLVDATVVRAVLVPAFMRLAGGANWWAPPLPALWRRRRRSSGPTVASMTVAEPPLNS